MLCLKRLSMTVINVMCEVMKQVVIHHLYTLCPFGRKQTKLNVMQTNSL